MIRRTLLVWSGNASHPHIFFPAPSYMYYNSAQLPIYGMSHTSSPKFFWVPLLAYFLSHPFRFRQCASFSCCTSQNYVCPTLSILNPFEVSPSGILLCAMDSTFFVVFSATFFMLLFWSLIDFHWGFERIITPGFFKLLPCLSLLQFRLGKVKLS